MTGKHNAIVQSANPFANAERQPPDRLHDPAISRMISRTTRDGDPPRYVFDPPVSVHHLGVDLVGTEAFVDVEDSDEVVATGKRNSARVLDLAQGMGDSRVEASRDKRVGESGAASHRVPSKVVEGPGKVRCGSETPVSEQHDRRRERGTRIRDLCRRLRLQLQELSRMDSEIL